MLFMQAKKPRKDRRKIKNTLQSGYQWDDGIVGEDDGGSWCDGKAIRLFQGPLEEMNMEVSTAAHGGC